MKAALQNTPQNDPKNPVLNPETWEAYKQEHYYRKSKDKKVYLDPWVKVFDKYFSGEFLIQQDIPYLPIDFSFQSHQSLDQGIIYSTLEES